MKSIVAGQRACSPLEFAELALGVDSDPFGSLFGGVAGESVNEYRARTDVAREVLAELWESDPESAEVAAELLRTAPVPLVRPRTAARRMRSGVAA
ncbi:hypothetical protein [Streptomyces sp. NRRL S-495]|uniref:hypothetical protein n=1 Tax=Streptomyces sp. NRRL S-495 TaxID=1609133 RepID=UPI0005F95CFC|nr:hypothetical protein [Streptomyces sp. NRRL S-495]KJY38134.1 hypothetical protein VR45_06830 [Streptomyces sp. NRRL S-495]